MRQWLPSAEVLPAHDQVVLALNIHGTGCKPRYAIARYFDGRWMSTLKHVTHWMPLPEVAPCRNPALMGEFACANRQQCWEPCGDLGKSEAHIKVASREESEAVMHGQDDPHQQEKP